MIVRVFAYLFFLLFIWTSLLFAYDLPDGIYYQQLFYNDVMIHLLEVDQSKLDIVAERAEGLQTVLDIALSHQAIAGINGGFFAPEGEHALLPMGILKIRDEWYGFPHKPRGAIGWSNEPPKVIYDQLLTENISVIIRIVPQSSPPYTNEKDWDHMEYIVGGTPILVRNGDVIVDFSSEKTRLTFLTLKHRRTAVGILENGHWILISTEMEGLTMPELAELMHSLGCIEALNLDGGGSATMVINQEIINLPVGEPRQVSDAILIKKKT